MKAVVLAGGKGTRLYPLTYTRPKILIPLLNRPMVHYILDYFTDRFDEIVFAAGHMIEELKAYLGTVDTKAKVDVVFEETPLGTGGAVKNLESRLDEPFLMMNGDIISSLRMDDFISFAEEKNGIGSITLFPSSHPEDYGVADLDESQRIARFVEKPAPGEAPSDLVNAGAYYLNPRILERIQHGRMVSLEREIFPFILDQGMFGYTFDGYWTDVGKTSTYLEANRMLLQNHGSGFEEGSDLGDRVEIVDPVWFGSESTMSSGKLGPNSCIGKGCEIASASIEGSVLFDKVMVGRNVSISDSIIGEGVVIEDNCRLTGCVVADMERIAEGTELANEKVGM
jgi:mannose-1-phosphate guanylyltransferase